MTRSSSSDRRRGRETPLARLSRPPEKGWPDGVLHHGARVLLLLVIALTVTLFFPPTPAPQVAGYQVGMVAEEDIIASLAFGVPKDPDELERERESAASAVPPTFRFDPEAALSMEEALDGFFADVASSVEEEDPDAALRRVLSDLGLVVTEAQREALRNPQSRDLLESSSLRAVREILPEGVLDEAARLDPITPSRILVVDPDGGERYLERDSVLTSREFYQEATALLLPDAGSELNELVRLALIRFMTPTLRFDALATEMDREAARRAVPTTRATILPGEAIVRANQQVGEAEVDRLRAYEEALRVEGGIEDDGVHPLSFAGSVVLNLLILGIFGFLLFFFQADIYGNFRWLLLQGVLVLAFAGAAGIVARNELPPELLPIAFVSLAVAVLWDGRVALTLAITLAVLAGAQVPFQSVHAWLPVFIAGSAAALSVRAVRRRAQTWIFIAIIAAAYLVALGTLGLLFGREPSAVATSFGWAGANAVVSAILAMGFLPVFEWFTRITTDQTLLEWADPNRPLLKRLSMEAPGTYAHTIHVANLSEAAANAIGANGLLCRVGVYYHDVGKMLKPQYFIENQPIGRNPHDKLKPATSATVVREHVTEGIRMAREANLPDALVDFIPEHHGTQEISFFFERAKEESDEEAPDAERYRYPGPKPQSRETAIVMLADSVESATRSLQGPTPERVRDLIESIVSGKIQQGQLDEAPLTLREIGIVKEQFRKVLSGTYHQRIDYPATRHLTETPTAMPDQPGEEVDPAPTGDGSTSDGSRGIRDASTRHEGEGDEGEAAQLREDPPAFLPTDEGARGSRSLDGEERARKNLGSEGS